MTGAGFGPWTVTADHFEVASTSQEAEEFEQRLAEARARSADLPVERFVDGKRVVWSPQAGSQEVFLSCPLFEVLYHGTRGPGKSDCLLMAYAQHVGRGHGAAWRGIIFRQTYPQLADLVAKSERWFRRIFPDARFNRGKLFWEFEGGEALLLRYMRTPDDYWVYHGHEYPFIGWDELTSWPDARCYLPMLSTCRSSSPNVPRMIRATTNPYGVGHNWVKKRWRLDGAWWRTVVVSDSRDETGQIEPPRAAIHGHIDENRILTTVDPGYKATISGAATNAAMADAWLRGSWDIVAGGMFSDLWSPRHNLVPRFDVPRTWRIDRSFDWGSSRPFSVGWWAESDGSDLRLSDGRTISTVRGDLFRVREWYGWSGRANEGLRMLASDVAAGIVERELMWRWRSGAQELVRAGPADSSIYAVENGSCIATDMEKPVRIAGQVHRGIRWTPADKGPGSRKNGWELVRRRIAAARPRPGLPREAPGLFVVADECPHFLRTMLTLPRDERDLDDVDTAAEDHVADEVRYRIRAAGATAGSGTSSGIY